MPSHGPDARFTVIAKQTLLAIGQKLQHLHAEEIISVQLTDVWHRKRLDHFRGCVGQAFCLVELQNVQ